MQPFCAVGGGNADYRRYPHKEKKKPRRIIERTVLLLTDGEGFYLSRRPSTGLLAGLWEFPSVEGHLSSDEAIIAARALGFDAQGAIEAVDGKHIFTHLEWHMKSFLVPCAKKPPEGFVLATPKELKEKYAIASAFRVFLDYIEQNSKYIK